MFKLCKNVSITRLQVGRHFCWDVHQSSAAAACVLKDRLINMGRVDIYKQDHISILHDIAKCIGQDGQLSPHCRLRIP